MTECNDVKVNVKKKQNGVTNVVDTTKVSTISSVIKIYVSICTVKRTNNFGSHIGKIFAWHRNA